MTKKSYKVLKDINLGKEKLELKEGQMVQLDEGRAEEVETWLKESKDYANYGPVFEELKEELKPVEASEKVENIDYNEMKVDEIKEVLNKRGVEYPSDAKKADLVALAEQ